MTAQPVTSLRNPSSFLADLARVAVATGGRPVAEALATGDQVSARHRHGASTARAVLAETDGDLDGAVRLHDQAARGWERSGLA
jgi:hypothetical protein